MRKKILIIDDDRAISHLTTIRLRAAGFEVDAAFDGPSGLEKASEQRPDAILLDIRMPDMDGFEVNACLKEGAGTATCPVVFLSANAQCTARRRALEVGGMAFIAKPYEMADVIAVIERVCASKPPASVPHGAPR